MLNTPLVPVNGGARVRMEQEARWGRSRRSPSDPQNRGHRFDPIFHMGGPLKIAPGEGQMGLEVEARRWVFFDMHGTGRSGEGFQAGSPSLRIGSALPRRLRRSSIK